MVKIAYLAWRSFQERYLQYVAALFLLLPALLTLVEVVRRYVFGQSFPWQQDAVTYGILTGVFLFFGITQSRNLHLRVTILRELLRARGGRSGQILSEVVELFVAGIGLAFCVFVVWHGVAVAERMVLMDRMADSQIVPLWPFFIVFLIGMGLMAISFLFQIYERVEALRGRDLGPQPLSREDGAETIL